MKVQFETESGLREIEVPMSCEDIVFGDFCDFKDCEAKMLQAVREEQEVEGLGAMQWMAEALRFAIKGDLDDVPLVGSEVELDIRGGIDLGSELSAWKLYAHFIATCSSYKPPAADGLVFKVKIEGTTYFAMGQASARLMTGMDATVGECVEALEMERQGKTMLSMGYGEGTVDFNVTAGQCAVLLRRHNEPLPAREAERKQFIEARKAIMCKMNLQQAADFRFFLLASLARFGANLVQGTFGRPGHIRSRLSKV